MSRASELFEKIKKAGEKQIDDFIITRKSEELFLDFKRSSDNGEGRFLSQNDRNNYAKAICGFGNSEGGVIVWGIDCSKQPDGSDIAKTKFPLRDVKKFVSLLEGFTSATTLPQHSKVENYPIPIDKNRAGFVITYVPQSSTTPLQSIYNKQFYIRAGSNFEPTPYQVLAGMFGKRPQPYVYNMFIMGPAKLVDKTISTQVGFTLYNQGPGIARHLFINTKIWSSPGKNSLIGFDTPDLNNWTGSFSFGMFMSMISKPEMRIAPEAQVQPLILHADFTPPFTNDFKIEISCGCEGSVTTKGALFNNKNTITSIYEKYVTKQPKWEDNDLHKVVQELLGRDNISNQ